MLKKIFFVSKSALVLVEKSIFDPFLGFRNLRSWTLRTPEKWSKNGFSKKIRALLLLQLLILSLFNPLDFLFWPYFKYLQSYRKPFFQISDQTVWDIKKVLLQTIFGHKICGNFYFKSFFSAIAVLGQRVKMRKK